MNAPHPLQSTAALSGLAAPMSPPATESQGFNFSEYWDIVVDNRWLVIAITVLTTLVGGIQAMLAKPIYESSVIIQVEDAGSARSLLGVAGAAFDSKTPASAEMEIIRSRMVIGEAVEGTRLYIDARPNFIPYIGDWLSRRASGLSDPGFLWGEGWVSGTEKIVVSQLEVPDSLLGAPLLITAQTNNRFTLAVNHLGLQAMGSVGTPLQLATPAGPVAIVVGTLKGKPGAEFIVRRTDRVGLVESLQVSLRLTERARQSGVIEASLQSEDRERLPLILNAIAQQYVRQNVERKAAEAKKTLAFLDTQLPQFKKQLNQSEEAYTEYRNEKGTVALDEQARLILSRNVELETKLFDSQQKRRELLMQLTPEHPAVKAVDDQIASWRQEINSLAGKMKGVPAVQRDTLRLQRDVSVNSQLYTQLLNNYLQLQLIREGKIGNVRIIDDAQFPRGPVRPYRGRIVAIALLLGLAAGVAIAILRNAFFKGIRSPQEIEAQTGLNVYSTIPLSSAEQTLAKAAAEKMPGVHLLAQASTNDMAVESLRSLRTTLQFAMLDATDNRVVITGATPGVGKSFVAANFAAVLAAGGKRVLLVDADLRRGHLNQYFGCGRDNGLSELVSGAITLEQGIRKDVVPRLDFLPTGVLPPIPAEMMMSGALHRVLDHLSAKYDLLIIDTAPVLAAADTLSLAMHAGTLLLVARAGQTQLGELHETARRLTRAGKHPTGVLFNAMDLARRHYGKYGYRYGYGGYRYRYYGYGQE